MHQSPNQQQHPPPKEKTSHDSERPLTPTLLLWRLWVSIRDRPRLFQQLDDSQSKKKAAQAPSPSMGHVMVRLLPAWILLIIILVIAPSLPMYLLTSAYQFVGSLTTHADPTPTLPSISPIFTPEVQFWANDIAVWSLTYQLNPNLIATIMQIESCGNPNVSSPAGANGLFQVMPLHFEPGEAHFDPQTNAQAGLTFLSYLMELSGGNVEGAMAGYNAGEWAVDEPYTVLPYETQRYVYWGTGIYQEAQSGVEESPRLNEWLEAGGITLCERAAGQLGLDVLETPDAGG